MSNPPAPSREERLAQKLRDNLHRRKAQARALADLPAGALDGETVSGASAESPDPLPKAPPSR